MKIVNMSVVLLPKNVRVVEIYNDDHKLIRLICVDGVAIREDIRDPGIISLKITPKGHPFSLDIKVESSTVDNDYLATTGSQTV